MNFQPLYTTARVMTALYRVVSTALLLTYLVRRVSTGERFHHVTRKQVVKHNYDELDR